MFDYKNYRALDIENKIKNNNLLHPFDLLLVGGTGSGKSSSINVFYGKNSAEVGYGADPKTKSIDSYLLNDYFRIWDTPGLGDGVREDQEYSKKIIDTLNRNIGNAEIDDYKSLGFIDMVLVVVEAGIRDMGTVNQIIKDLILPNISHERVVVGINQADFAMKGKNFDYLINRPNYELLKYLEERKKYIEDRVMLNHGVNVPVIYYSAETGYNVDKLMDLLIEKMPRQRRKLIC